MIKKLFLALLVTAAMFFVSGCAGVMSNIPSQEDLAGVRGMSKKAVLQKFGQPTDKSWNGNVWYYKKPSNNVTNNLVLIGTMGLLGGKNSIYADIVKISFKNDKADSIQIMEDAYNINFSQAGLARDAATDLSNSVQKDSNSSSLIGMTMGLVNGVLSGNGSAAGGNTEKKESKPAAPKATKKNPPAKKSPTKKKGAPK